jgi:imidazole glycerol-phosphate synthase subunit HisF
MDEKKKIKSPFKKDGMFNEANPLVFGLAKELRKNMTHAEMVLWNHLKAGINGLKFRRQHPLGIYVADFYCHQIKLIIEVDGSIHNKKEIKEYDSQRENNLIAEGYTVIRFTNYQVLNEIQSVLSTITTHTQNLINNYKNLKA